jgi:membrane protease YdiL (CAAX protease family)
MNSYSFLGYESMSANLETSINPERPGLSVIGRWWLKIPLMLRAIITGFLVFEILQLGQALLLFNLRLRPDIPWIVPLIVFYLYLGWRYFSGWGWPLSTQALRRERMRLGPRSHARTVWGYATALIILFHMAGLAVVLSAVVQFPEASFEPPGFLIDLPEWTAFAFVLVFALAAGVSEEVGFRGYMLVPLEQRYGAAVAVIIVALLFWLAHFSSASFLHRFPLLFGSGLFAGFLAIYSKSLGPPIAVHFLADVIGFTTVTRLFGLPTLYTEQTIWETGTTPVFWVALTLTILGGMASIVMLVKLSRIDP